MGVGGKGGSQTIGYKYYLGMHQALCHGPIDAITRITCDDRIAWEGINTGGPSIINAPELFGGEKREGGVSGTIDIEMGESTQGQNSYLVNQLGSLIPAYRRVVAAVFRQCYLGNNPYLKPWRFRGQRIFVRQDGLAQWYPEKAAVTSSDVTLTYDLFNDFVPLYDVPGGGFHPLSRTVGPFTRDVGVYAGDAEGEGTIIADNQLFFNGKGWPRDGITYRRGFLAGVVPELGDILNPSAITTIPGGTMLYRLPAGTTLTVRLKNFVSGSVCQATGLFTISGLTRDMNPVHIIRECLTDPDWGMGYTDADIDDDNFRAAADQIHSEGLGVSLLWDRQIKLEEFIDEIKKHIDAAVYVSRRTGKFVIKLIRKDYVAGSLLLLDESNIARVDDPSRSTYGELINSVTVNYWDATTGKDASLTVTDPAMVRMQGATINTPVQYPGFTNARNASIAGQRDLKTLSTPSLSTTIYANSDAKDLNIGDVFRFSWSKWSISETVMRVVNIAYGTGKKKQIRIECIEDTYNVSTSVIITDPVAAWENPSVFPNPVVDQFAIEAPYYEMVQNLGQAAVDSDLATKPDMGYVVAVAARADSSINAGLWTDSGAGYEQVGSMDFCPNALLTTAISATQTAFVIDNMEDIEEVAQGSHLQIGSELMRIDSLDWDTGAVEVGRGVLDTVPVPHANNARAYFWDFYAGTDPTEYVSGETVSLKVTPASGVGVLPLEQATAMTVTLAQRAFRPYAPGNLTVNGDSYLDSTYFGALTIAWAHRDRREQTSGVLIDHTYGDIGPEVGTVYRLQGYIDNVLVHTEDDIAGTSTTWTPSADGLVRVEVSAKRDSLYSWQAATHEFDYTNTEFRLTDEGDERVTEDNVLRSSED